jgi:hypothetical protein
MKHHIFIAGTGRAGTSFLVQFLHECGLETHLSKHESGWWDENANAGLEDFPAPGADLPYVIKSPWFYEFADVLLNRKDIVLDAAIIPVRDLVEAASSRAILEFRGRYAQGQLADDESTWETWAVTPGGIVYSMNPLDQARILALGFHEVVKALTRHNVPIVFLDFPRFANDAEYTYEALKDFIPARRDVALAAHASLAAPSKIRAGKEISDQQADTSASKHRLIRANLNYPSIETVDLISLRRELRRLRDLTATLSAERDELDKRCTSMQAERSELLETKALAEARLTEAEVRLRECIQTLAERLAEVESSRSAAKVAESELRQKILVLQAQLGAFETSTSWKLTRPLRSLKRWLAANR